MFKPSQKLLLMLSIALFAGCATQVPLQQRQVSEISRDTTASALEKIVGDAAVASRSEFEVAGVKYLARSYKLQTGTTSEMTMACTPACIPIFIQVPVLTEYVIVQRLPSMNMHAWGTLEQLSKDPDVSVSSIMPTLKARMAEQQKAK